MTTPFARDRHRLMTDYYDAFVLWEQRERENERAYAGLPASECSVDGSAMALEFQRFITPYLGGYVLDVGSGVQPMPLYLRDHPSHLVWGVDPLPDDPAHPRSYRCVQAFAELLPWRAETFDTVIAATSLDHCLSPRRAISEIARVLRPGGPFLCWVRHFPDAPEYDPRDPPAMPADEHHVFHFDQPWFERWCAEERLILWSRKEYTSPKIATLYAWQKFRG